MSNREFTAHRTMLANAFATAGAELLEYMDVSSALAAIPNTDPPQYVVAGTLQMIAKVLPATDAVEQPTGDLTDEQIDSAIVKSGVMDRAWPSQTALHDFARAIARAAIAAHLGRQPKAEQQVIKTWQERAKEARERKVFVDDERFYMREELADWHAANLARQAQAEPEGWKLVPVEPTDEMMWSVDTKVGSHLWDGSQSTISDDELREVWAKMIAAVQAEPSITSAGAQNAEAIRNQAESEEARTPEFNRKTDEGEYGLVWELAKFSAPRQNGREFSESGLMMAVDFVRNQALEDAAEACGAIGAGPCGEEGTRIALDCIAAVRALKGQTGSANTLNGGDHAV